MCQYILPSCLDTDQSPVPRYTIATSHGTVEALFRSWSFRKYTFGGTLLPSSAYARLFHRLKDRKQTIRYICWPVPSLFSFLAASVLGASLDIADCVFGFQIHRHACCIRACVQPPAASSVVVASFRRYSPCGRGRSLAIYPLFASPLPVYHAPWLIAAIFSLVSLICILCSTSCTANCPTRRYSSSNLGVHFWCSVLVFASCLFSSSCTYYLTVVEFCMLWTWSGSCLN